MDPSKYNIFSQFVQIEKNPALGDHKSINI